MPSPAILIASREAERVPVPDLRQAGTPAATRPRVKPAFIAALLLAGYFVMAVSASRTKSTTFDEIVHVTAGYSAWINHDQRFDPGNGDFVKRWAVLPLLITRPNFPPLEGEAWRNGDFFPMSRDFMFHRGNDPDAILLQSRSMVALLGVALGALVFVCSRRLFGDTGGIISVAVFAFCPHMLAHGALVSTDLALTFALLAATWCLWRLLHVVSWPTLLASVLAFSLLVISKMSAVLIAPIALILIVARCFNREPWVWRLRQETALLSRGRQGMALVGLIAVHAFAGWIAIWTVFEFKYLARAEPAAEQLTLLRTPDANVTGLIGRVAEFSHRHRLLPEGYLKGMEELVGISKRRASFMNGEWHTGGRVAFFPYAFWVKTPPALLCLLALGLVGAIWSAQRRGWLYAVMPLCALLFVYAAVALTQGLNIGHRHILPVYPALFILAGSAALLEPMLRRSAKVAIALLAGWYAIDSLVVRPHYLAYFSPVAGGPAQGYRRLVDSSLDWGQDLPGLKSWLDEHNAQNRDTVFFSYFGTGDPDHHDIASWRLPGFPEWRELQVFAYTPGVYAVSATMFQQVYSTAFGAWNRRYEEEYQATLQRLRLTPSATADNDALASALRTQPEPVWQEVYNSYEKLRFARLCAWLRATNRAPDAQMGHSILIWKLDDRAIQDALWGPPLELRAAPVH
jgi:hypothetical protein